MTTTTTTTHVRLSSLVKHYPPLQRRKMKKYQLIYNYQEGKYNGGVRLDPEDLKFTEPNASLVIRDLAWSLAGVSKAIGRACCYNRGTPIRCPRGLTTAFYVGNYHILTTADLMEDENGNLSNHEILEFAFTLRVSTLEWEHVTPTLVPAFFVCKTENLLLLRTSAPTIPISPILPNKEFMTTTTFEYVNREWREYLNEGECERLTISSSPSNTDPSYVNATSICVVGYCDGVPISDALADYSRLPVNIQDVTIMTHVQDAPARYCITASMHHGACGSPVFCPADPTKFIGVVLGAAETFNFNIILTVLSDEFDTILAAIER